VLATVQAGMASGAMDEPILARSFTDLLVRSALVCFPHSWEEGAAGPSLFAPAALRRAKAFIDAHAPEPITLVDIAEAARISPRHLQNEFRRHYGMTPTGYLRQARLTLAREALLRSAGGPGDSVASIARAAGFAHPSRFAAAYRIAFGEYPRDTLRR
jgi:transcriptional regulator GlxA family with amidase domain